MLGFVLHHDAMTFIERIGVKGKKGGKSETGRFETAFDAYWIFAQIGMIKDKFDSPDPATSSRFTGGFRGHSKAHADLISGVAFYYYCKARSMTGSDNELLKEMASFFSEEFNTLNEEGYKLLNGYANAGFTIVHSILGDDCQNLHEFLLECHDLIES